jgi:site-specific recombinase XerC
MPGPPKSGKVRSVPLIDHAARALRAHTRRDRFTEPDDLVFSTRLGEHLSDDQVRDRFYETLEAAGPATSARETTRLCSTTCGTPSAHLRHHLRHTFGTPSAH